HPRHGRVRDPGAPGRARHAHCRQGAQAGVLFESRLARRRSARRARRGLAAAGRARAAMGARCREGSAMRRSPLLHAFLGLGFAFRYVPIAVLAVYSFNASRLVTVWDGWSTRWYAALFENEALLRAAWLSMRLALVSAAHSAVLGTLAGI